MSEFHIQEKDAEIQMRLPAMMDMAMAENFYEAVLKNLGAKPLSIKADQVQLMTSGVIQILLSLDKTLQNKFNQPLICYDVSEAMRRSFVNLGLDKILASWELHDA